jgi:hypothetical protein
MRSLAFRISGFALLFAAMIWPAIFNSAAFYFPDSLAYIDRGDSATNKLKCAAGHLIGRTVAACAEPNDQTTADINRAPAQTASDPLAPKTTKVSMTGRSKYYGILLSIGKFRNEFWISLLLQAAALILSITLLLKTLNQAVWPDLLLICFLLCVVTDAPFFVSFLMPDLFVGIAILTVSSVLAIQRKLSMGEAIVAYGLTLSGPLFHDSASPIVFLLMGIALAWSLTRRTRPVWINYGVLALALVSAVAAQAGLTLRQKHAHETWVRIPFLSARLVEDGPGTSFLRKTCPANGFALCQYVQRFPLASNDFLWRSPEQGGVWGSSSKNTEGITLTDKRISDQDLSFAVAVFKYEPIGVLFHGFYDAAHQLIDFSLDEFNISNRDKDALDSGLPEEYAPELHRSASYKGNVPVFSFSLLNYAFVVSAVAYIGFMYSAPARRISAGAGIWRLLAWLLIGILLNAAICGAISGVFARYEARVIWLIPLSAILVYLLSRKSFRRETSMLNSYSNRSESTAQFAGFALASNGADRKPVDFSSKS